LSAYCAGAQTLKTRHKKQDTVTGKMRSPNSTRLKRYFGAIASAKPLKKIVMMVDRTLGQRLAMVSSRQDLQRISLSPTNQMSRKQPILF
jgi:hypothetical protein